MSASSETFVESLRARAAAYVGVPEEQLGKQLGAGQDGAVWRTPWDTAIKAFEREEQYRRELRSYQRLSEKHILRIERFAVPAFLGCSDQLLVIEMGLVVRPFLLDFGKAYVDEVPPYFHDQEIMAEWSRSGRERFGQRWPQVLAILRALRSIGIYYLDVSPSNIMFGDDSSDDVDDDGTDYGDHGSQGAP